MFDEVIEANNKQERKKRIRRGLFIATAAVSAVIIVLSIVLIILWRVTYVKLDDVIEIPIVYLDPSARVTVDRTADYLGHPDLVLNDRGELITMYPEGHGKGAIVMRRSSDMGKNWSAKETTPESWSNSRETPTVYSIKLHSGEEKLVMISGCPAWKEGEEDGFNFSYSDDGGYNWSEFTNWYGKEWAEENGKEPYDCIVAMSSLTQVKRRGFYVNEWLGTFHDHEFNMYKSYLSFDIYGNMEWSEPELLLGEYNDISREYNLCEPEIIRTQEKLVDGVKKSELILIMRNNKHEGGSMACVSYDEGITWTEPVFLPNALTGDRHKAEYDASTGKWLITFRQVLGIKPNVLSTSKLYGVGWVAWVGDEDVLFALAQGDWSKGCGDAYIVLAENHGGTLDCGYAGTAVDDESNFVLVSYGRFSKSTVNPYILSVSFNLRDMLGI
ncbi:MAG: glycoside hydrolase [Clostridia bacterium]|nr:glycoside hydrolase [Clostridia bacterium]